MIEQAINTLLRADAQLIAMTGDRIRPVSLAQDDPALSRIAYQNVTHESYNSHAGPDAWAKVTFQIDALAATQAQAITLAGHIKRVLNGYVGTVASTVIQPCLLEQQGDLETVPYDGEEKPVYRISCDYKIQFRDA